jgi:hypothetical protein
MVCNRDTPFIKRPYPRPLFVWPLLGSHGLARHHCLTTHHSEFITYPQHLFTHPHNLHMRSHHIITLQYHIFMCHRHILSNTSRPFCFIAYHCHVLAHPYFHTVMYHRYLLAHHCYLSAHPTTPSVSHRLVLACSPTSLIMHHVVTHHRITTY